MHTSKDIFKQTKIEENAIDTGLLTVISMQGTKINHASTQTAVNDSTSK